MLHNEEHYKKLVLGFFDDDLTELSNQLDIRGAYRLFDLYSNSIKKGPIPNSQYLMDLYRYELRLSRKLMPYIHRYEIQFRVNIANMGKSYIDKIRGKYTFESMCRDWYENYDGHSDDVYAVKDLRNAISHHDILQSINRDKLNYWVSELSYVMPSERESIFNALNKCSNGLSIKNCHIFEFKDPETIHIDKYMSKKHKKYQ